MKENQILEKQEWFKKLPRYEQQDIIKSLLSYHLQMVTTKMSALASLSALSATMVIVATLNKDLLNLDINSAKVILTVLILLIPLSLFIFFFDVERGAIGNKKIIESYIGETKTNPSWFDYIASNFPFVVTAIYFIIAGYLIYTIWCL